MESSEFHILIYFEVKEEKKNKKILLNFQSICDWSSILINCVNTDMEFWTKYK